MKTLKLLGIAMISIVVGYIVSTYTIPAHDKIVNEMTETIQRPTPEDWSEKDHESEAIAYLIAVPVIGLVNAVLILGTSIGTFCLLIKLSNQQPQPSKENAKH